MNRSFVSLGAGLALIAVVLGAFGTHSLRGRVSARDVEIWSTGVHYHLVHAVGLVLLGLLSATLPGPWLRRAAMLHATGIAFFGGSLYLLVLTQQRWLGAITPIGGVCFIAGWACVVIAANQPALPPGV